MYADAMKTTDNVADDIAKNVDDVGKSADDVPQRAESGDEIGAVVEESGMKEEMKNFDTKKKSDHHLSVVIYSLVYKFIYNGQLLNLN